MKNIYLFKNSIHYYNKWKSENESLLSSNFSKYLPLTFLGTISRIFFSIELLTYTCIYSLKWIEFTICLCFYNLLFSLTHVFLLLCTKLSYFLTEIFYSFGKWPIIYLNNSLLMDIYMRYC